MTDRNELKVQALLEKISKITAGYENQEADYRVEITLISNRLQEVEQELAEAKALKEDSEILSSEKSHTPSD